MFDYLFTGLAIVFASAIVATFFIPSVRTGLWDVGLAAPIAAGVFWVGGMLTRPKPDSL